MTAENQKIVLTAAERELLETLLPEEAHDQLPATGIPRRDFLKLITVLGGGVLSLPLWGAVPAVAATEAVVEALPASALENAVQLSLKVNGAKRTLAVDPRMTLLDALRERLRLTGSKKGCDHGQCGACTVILDGRRVLSCLTLAATCEGRAVTTIEGLAGANGLHPMQAAFLKHDGFQCGYCTPGQICSAVALMQEARNGDASYVTADVRAKPAPIQLTEEEIRERMSGNICRCGAYPNIIAAIQEVHSGRATAQSWQFTGEKQTDHETV